MRRSDHFKVIAHYLTQLATQTKILNSLNLQDINVHAENFFRDLLNLILDYNFININIVEKNSQAIDLGDAQNRIAIQVTSTSDFAKIRHTHNGFVAGGHATKYDRLVILIIGEKKNYRQKFIGGNGTIKVSFDEDVWDLEYLMRIMQNLPLPKLAECHTFLRNELRISEPRTSSEISTLIRLIEVLSLAEEGISIGDSREDPDPENKINDRFSEHSEFLKLLYQELHEIYGRALAEVTRQSDLSHIRVRKLQVYLMQWSDRILGEFGGDPKAALEALTERVLQMMGDGDSDFDDSAVRFYLIAQLIACNVFPNKQSLHA